MIDHISGSLSFSPISDFPSFGVRFGCLGWGVKRTWFDETGWICEEAKQLIQPYNWTAVYVLDL